jgi:hypothetical protein
MYLIFSTYQVAPMTFWDYAIPCLFTLVLIFLLVRAHYATRQETIKREAEARRLKRHQERQRATSLPSKRIAV